MDSHDSGVSVYAEAKGEYTKQLVLFIVPTFHRFFMNCLIQASEEESNQKRQLWKFQELLSQIPEWNIDKVQREVQKFVVDIQCDYLEELITAVFIAHTKVLTAIRIGNKNKRVQITIPKLEHFLHRALSECSRLLWSSAYLFHNELSPIEKQKNHRQIEGLLHEGIGQAIRGLLPVKNILKDYLSDPTEDDEKDEKDDEKEDEKEDDIKLPQVIKAFDIPEPVKVTETSDIPETSDVVESDKVPETSDSTESDKVPEIPESTKIPETSEPPDVPKQQTLIIDTEPSVRFTNYDQVIKENGDITSIGYVENTNSESDAIEFIDESEEALSDYEDITQNSNEPLSIGDFETL